MVKRSVLDQILQDLIRIVELLLQARKDHQIYIDDLQNHLVRLSLLVHHSLLVLPKVQDRRNLQDRPSLQDHQIGSVLSLPQGVALQVAVRGLLAVGHHDQAVAVVDLALPMEEAVENNVSGNNQLINNKIIRSLISRMRIKLRSYLRK